MLDPKHLLSDAQMKEFIANGYLVLKSSLPKEYHQEVFRKTEEVFEREGNPGNNILPRVPEIQNVFNQPEIRGAFSSILGPDYTMHIHRHPHINKPHSKDGGWHKDSYWGYKKVRYHRNRWAMAFYYPQDVTPENGPTAVIPHTQYYVDRPENMDEIGVPVCGEAGTIAIVHFDIWHRSTANNTENNRYMMKFQFTRMSEPDKPAWNNQEESWRGNGVGNKNEAVWSQIWDWSRGSRTTGNGNGSSGDLATSIEDPDESTRLNAAYGLGKLGETGIPDLITALKGNNEAAQLDAAYALSTAGEPAIPELEAALSHDYETVRAHAVFALGDMGITSRDVVPAIAAALKDKSEWVRHHAAEALGTLSANPDVSVPALSDALKDADGQVRYNAAYSLARIGPDAAGAIPALADALNDENRYVAGHSAVALQQIGTPEATEILLNHLTTSRWCPITHKEDLY
jgi:hypothetical protein